jgi:CheY-like chemotaxis protein
MPRETGVAFMKWLRSQRDKRAAIRAVAVTAYPEDFIREHDDVRAFDAFFVKPLDAPRFLGAIEPILSRSQPPTQRLAV